NWGPGPAPQFHRLDRGGRMAFAGPQATQREIERWRQRERRLIEALQSVDDERRRLDDELLKVEQQVAYYDSLTREMKRELGRPGLSSLLSSLRRAKEGPRARRPRRHGAGAAEGWARGRPGEA